jgi:hypothetical protein
MFKKLLAFFQLKKYCAIFSKVLLGLSSVLAVITYLKSEVEGSEVGTKITPYLDKVAASVGAFNNGLTVIVGVVCPDAATVSTKANNLDEALAELDDITADLNKLSK